MKFCLPLLLSLYGLAASLEVNHNLLESFRHPSRPDHSYEAAVYELIARIVQDKQELTSFIVKIKHNNDLDWFEVN